MDIYAEVTDRIITALEQGTVPWHKPWVGGSSGCISYSTGKPYSLLNHILLGGVSGEYITFKQCTLAGGHVRKGEKSIRDPSIMLIRLLSFLLLRRSI